MLSSIIEHINYIFNGLIMRTGKQKIVTANNVKNISADSCFGLLYASVFLERTFPQNWKSKSISRESGYRPTRTRPGISHFDVERPFGVSAFHVNSITVKDLGAIRIKYPAGSKSEFEVDGGEGMGFKRARATWAA